MNMQYIQQIDSQINDLKNKKIQAIMHNATDQELAEIFHEKTCKLNHEDMCGWFYEIETEYIDPKSGQKIVEYEERQKRNNLQKREIVNWNGSTHQKYVNDVKKLRKTHKDLEDIGIDPSTLHAIREVLRNNKVLMFEQIFQLDKII